MSEVRTILICSAQVPFVWGGTEALVDALQHELHARGYEVDRVALPFRWNPTKEIVRNCSRVFVLRDRRKIGELEGDTIAEDEIMNLIAGDEA